VVYFTKWNINKQGGQKHPGPSNMIMLPTWKVFARAWGRKGGKQGGVLAPGANTHPCHDRGHPAYNRAVATSLNEIWSKVAPQVDEHKLTDATDIAGELNDKIDEFADVVAGRTTTQAKWKAMVNGDEGAKEQFFMAVV
jgi:hypothetical protein